MLVDRPERYCSQCIATRPRCDNCGAPIGADSWRLHDDRLQCPRCHSTAIYEPQVSRQIYRETVGYVVAQLGLALNVGVEFRLVDAPTLRSIRAQDSDYSPSASERTLGLYQRQGRLRAIYLLYGIPRLLFRTTVAHEYAHAWQGENCPLLHDKFLIEGFAEWVAYRHLVWLGCTRAADRMLNSRHPYRPALEHALSLESYLGTAGLLDYIKRAE
jgi:ribosomal protein S27AE